MTPPEVADVLARLEQHGSADVRAQMAPRYGIPAEAAFGVPMAQMKMLATSLGHDHELAAGLWASTWYEARMVAAMIDVPEQVSGDQMDAWAGDFDSWAICDTVCFTLFDRTSEAWTKVDAWSAAPQVYVKRASFALLWSLALHDKGSPDMRFEHGLALIDREADDDRPLVAKSLLMAARAIATRGDALHHSTRELGLGLMGSEPGPRRRLGSRIAKL